VVRLSTRGDPGFLAEMLYETVYWRDDGAEERPTLEDLMSQPRHARFVDGWGEPTDLAVFALDRRDEPIGAIWGRRLDDTGVLDSLIAVFPEFRRQGVGSLLLGSFVARAGARGDRAVRVHVDDENPARRFLAGRGFTPADAATMSRALAEHDPG
jgi:GNAT superfamily N-acetyltransferase